MPLKKKSGHRQFHGRETWGQGSGDGGGGRRNHHRDTEDTEKRQKNAVSLLNKAGVRGRRFGLYVC